MMRTVIEFISRYCMSLPSRRDIRGSDRIKRSGITVLVSCRVANSRHLLKLPKNGYIVLVSSWKHGLGPSISNIIDIFHAYTLAQFCTYSFFALSYSELCFCVQKPWKQKNCLFFEWIVAFTISFKYTASSQLLFVIILLHRVRGSKTCPAKLEWFTAWNSSCNSFENTWSYLYLECERSGIIPMIEIEIIRLIWGKLILCLYWPLLSLSPMDP